MGLLEGVKVLLGVTSSIAAYKTLDLIREIKREGGQVKVVATPFALEFVGKLSFETLSGEKVFWDWREDPLAHINLARWADVFLIAPCTVNTLSKIALGIGDNLLTTTALAYKGPLLVAPAANTVMYKNEAIQENLNKLKERGVVVIKPESGLLACEEEGEGKLASVDRLLDWIKWAVFPKKLEGKRVLITCGSTREYIDPVRYISNHSSGAMGFSLARVARWMGADVKVVAGFTTAKEPPEVSIRRVTTAQEMLEEVLKEKNACDILIMNAAVADYRPVSRKGTKIKKKDKLIIELEKNPDILEILGREKEDLFLVGFALETENLVENAKEKLRRKKLDLIIANPAETMGAENHRGFLITEDSVEEFSFPSKLESAQYILNFVAGRLKDA